VVEIHPEPGKYAMAVSLKPASVQDKPPYLQKRGSGNDAAYGFTLDFDFHTPFQKRASNMQIGIDYSDLSRLFGVLSLVSGLRNLNTKTPFTNTKAKAIQVQREKVSLKLIKKHGGDLEVLVGSYLARTETKYTRP